MIRSATQDLADAKERRERLGKFDPNEEARQRGKKKLKSALSKIKMKSLTSSMLSATRGKIASVASGFTGKKGKRRKSLKRTNSAAWDRGGD